MGDRPNLHALVPMPRCACLDGQRIAKKRNDSDNPRADH